MKASDFESSSNNYRDINNNYKHDLVISGISGRYPESENIDEFAQNLLNGVDMVTETERRWPSGLFGLPKRNGTLKDISKFDAQFFGINPKQADQMDPQLRLLLEVAYEAIFDSGINPIELKGSRTGVYIGASSSEALYAYSRDPTDLSGYSMTGCATSMLANRLSFFFDFKGPSFTIDTACSSSLVALDCAIQSLKAGYCEYAIVGGVNILTRAQASLQFQRLGMLSSDGKCKSFDADGKGYVRSETISVVFLQRKSTCRKFYAMILNSKVNTDGAKENGITYPSGEVQTKLLEEIYMEANINPAHVIYIEAHGTGTKAGDPQELNSITKIFTKNRQTPLLIGSTKSNMGHPEAASGLAALSKILISIRTGIIPGNLHFNEPNNEIDGLIDGRLKVVDKNCELNGSLIALNSFGFGGANAHLLLQANLMNSLNKENKSLWNDINLTEQLRQKLRIFQFSSRTEKGLNEILDLIEKKKNDLALHCILEPNSLTNNQSHPYRGFILLNSQNPIRESIKLTSPNRPIWFVFSGMGTQWEGMGRDLMQIEIFRKSMHKSAEILEPYNLNLIEKINGIDGNSYKRTLNSFVGIASIQIGLVDCLRFLDIKPDGILGHSVGELGCAYADESLSHEETLLAAYYRGKCIEEANLPPGAMAAIGLSWEECKNKCPDGIVPACHNSHDTVTISGPKDLVNNFVKQLKSEGIFAKEVESSNVAFHSYYMSSIAPILKNFLENVIKTPKQRSSRWISSSIPVENWKSDLAKYSSADYHVNNLCSAVLFQEALKYVPSNAITIEIAPHALLQAILKRSLSKENIFIGLLNKNSTNQIEHFMTQMGRLYLNGVNFKSLKFLINDTNQSRIFPVPIETGFLSPLVKWDHSHNWNVPNYSDFIQGSNESNKFSKINIFSYTIDLKGNDSYLLGHQIDGRVLYPATGYLYLVWQSYAKMLQLKNLGMIDSKNLILPPVVFENVEIHRATILKMEEKVNFQVNLMSKGDFELTENGNSIVTGEIKFLEDKIIIDQNQQNKCFEELSIRERPNLMLKDDIYKELRLRGYEYKNEFQPIEKSDFTGTLGILKWNGYWVTFLDAMLQISILGHKRSLLLPTRIRALKINPEQHFLLGNNQCLAVIHDPFTQTTLSGGVEIHSLHTTVAPKRQVFQPTIIERVNFVPYFDNLESINYLLNRKDQPHIKEIKNYFNECSELMMKILNGENRNTEKSNGEFGNFLLKNYLDEFNFIKSLDEDKHLNLLTNRVANFKSLIDVALENMVIKSKNQKIRILEISYSMNFILGHKLSNIIRSHPQLCDQIELVYLQANSLTQAEQKYYEDINKNLLIQIEKFDWNFVKGNLLCFDFPTNLSNFDIVILNNVSCLSNFDNFLQWIDSCLTKLSKEFILVVEDFFENEQFKDLIVKLQSVILNKNAINGKNFVRLYDTWNQISHKNYFSDLKLFKLKKNYKKHTLCQVDDIENFKWLNQLKSDLTNSNVDRIYLLSQLPETTGIIGFVNCLRKEFNGEKIRCILSDEYLTEVPIDILNKDLVMNVKRNGKWGSMRHVFENLEKPIINTERDLYELESIHDEINSFVSSLQRGDLSTLRWIQSPELNIQKNQIVCDIAYAALNFRDIMLATGKLSPEAIPNYHKMQDNLLGMEFSGESNGKNYMGMIQAQGLSTQVKVDKNYLWEIPDNWSLDEAATVPVAYSTAYYALIVRANLKKNETILIHAGSGAVGQAAISIALSLNCKVFVTVSSNDKKEYLKSRFRDELKEDSFSNSRDISFEKHIMTQTRGRGVDVVLNSLSDEKLQASLRVLAQHGRFLEIGKFDLNKNSNLGMSIFLKNISFHGILLDSLFDDSSANSDWQIVYDLVNCGIKTGVVKPLNSTIFDKSQIEQAFRYMAQGKHIGKVLIKCRNSEKAQILGKVWFNPQKIYIITGGLGGFGLELAQWLIEHGARNLILTSRTGIKTGYQKRKIDILKQEFQLDIQVLALDVKNESECKLLIDIAQGVDSVSRKIGGIFHLAALLEDGLLENQTVERFRRVIDVKYQGVINLDKFTRDTKVMDDEAYFVVFSSVTSGRGNLGQSSYGFANSSMERVCECRRKNGKNALAIQWGAIGDVGLVIESTHMNGTNETVVGGTYPQKIYGSFKILEHILLKSSNSVIWSCFVPAFDGIKEKKVSQVHDKSLIDVVANILGIKDWKQVRNENLTFVEMGLDSLMSVEIKQILEQDFNLNLNTKEIQNLTIEKLKNIQKNQEVKSMLDENKVIIVNEKQIKILMPKNVIEKLNDIEHSDNPLFIVHPIEGNVEMLRDLAKNVKVSVYGLQFTKEAIECNNLKDLGEFYWNEIDKSFRDREIYLCGYSFGASVAFQMSFEKKDRVRNLILLDGSHSYVNVQINAYKNRLKLDSRSETESEALCMFYQQFESTKSRTELKAQISNLKTFDHRVEFLVKQLMQNEIFKFEEDDLELALRAFVSKILMSFEYEPSELDLNELLLIKSEEQTNLVSQSNIKAVLGDDFGLGKVFRGKIKIKVVSGNHKTFIQKENAIKLAEIINNAIIKF